MVRYGTPDHEGETRRERNLRFGVDIAPEPEVPDHASHVWEWFWELSAARGMSETGALPIGYADIRAWMDCTGTRVIPPEIDMLTAMDRAYRSALSQELSDIRERQQATRRN